jgi:hypothetical protein
VGVECSAHSLYPHPGLPPARGKEFIYHTTSPLV